MTKAFHGDILKNFVDVMNEHADKLCSKFNNYYISNSPCNLTEGKAKQMFSELSLALYPPPPKKFKTHISVGFIPNIDS